MSVFFLTLTPPQSVTVPLQGFLNAIVYGHTREDFVHMMGTTGRFFAEEQDSSPVQVIRYSSEYGDDDDASGKEESSKLKAGFISSNSLSAD